MNDTNSTIPPFDVATEILDHISVVTHFISLAIHIFYILVTITSKKLRRVKYLYVNHTNLVSIVYLIISCAYSISPYPHHGFQLGYHDLCLASEIIWIFSKYIRVYSVLMLAIHRYLAVFRADCYRKLNSSYLFLFSLVLLTWLISIGLPFASKYLFRTTINSKNPFFCLDGFSPSYYLLLSYFLFNYMFMAFLPSVVIIYIYIVVTSKLNAIREDLKKTRAADRFNENHIVRSIQSLNLVLNSRIDDVHIRYGRKRERQMKLENKNKKQRLLANQMLGVYIFIMLSIGGWIVFQLKNLITNFFTGQVAFRMFVRIWCALMFAAVPLVSLYFIPARRRVFSPFKIKQKPHLKTIET